MPYDGDPQKFETPAAETDVFSLEGLIAWLEKQNPDTTYRWLSYSRDCDGGCLFHRYLREHGECPTFGYERIAAACGGRVLDCKVAFPEPNTYGDALARAYDLRKLLAERNG